MVLAITYRVGRRGTVLWYRIKKQVDPRSLISSPKIFTAVCVVVVVPMTDDASSSIEVIEVK